MRTRTKKLTLLGVCTALALILSYAEAMLPPIWSAVPGIKMGLPNVMIIFLLYKYGFREAIAVSLIRILIAAMLFGSVMTLAYSLAGGMLSLAIMAPLKKTGAFSTVGVSVVGGISHNIAQILVAIAALGAWQIGYYMALLVISGTVAGVLVGVLGSILLRYLEKV